MYMHWDISDLGKYGNESGCIISGFPFFQTSCVFLAYDANFNGASGFIRCPALTPADSNLSPSSNSILPNKYSPVSSTQLYPP